MTSTLPPLVQAVSGAVGSASANALAYPLDLLTTRLQLAPPSAPTGPRASLRILADAVRRRGPAALYDGLSTDTAATLLSNFFYFLAYSWLRARRARNRTPAVAEELALGFAAGVASRALSTPLSIITQQLQADPDDPDAPEEGTREGVERAVRSIYAERGLAGFWSGFRTTAVLSLNPALTLALYQLFRRLRPSARPNPPPFTAFLGAATSNTLAVALLYPLVLAKTRLQARGGPRSLAAALRGACKGGLGGLYQGVGAQLAKGALAQGVTFLVKGRIEQLVVRAYVRAYRARAVAAGVP